MSELPDPIPVAEWREQAKRLFGDNPLNWRFRCTFCKHEHTPRDFADAGAKPGRAARECLGRALIETGKKGRSEIGGLYGKKGLQPCDWACFGLFGGGEGCVIVLDEADKLVECFPFAEPT